MKKWTDRNGRDWTLDINVGSVRKVKMDCGLDLLNITNTEVAVKLGDPMMLCDVLWSLVEKQAKANGVDPEMFGEGLAGDTLADAVDALLEEIIDFFPKARRTILEKALVKARKYDETMIEKAIVEVDKMDMAALMQGQ